MIKTAIIAALEREIHPLVKAWSPSGIECGGRALVVYQSADTIAVAGGIGFRRAALAARAVTEKFRPQTLVSAGLAGSLIRSLKAGKVVTPNLVVDATNAMEYRCNTTGDVGSGVLVTAEAIAGQDSKLSLVERFHGLIVDMEAAGVAKVAKEFNTSFCCVKAISDELDFAMPPLNRFVDSQGDFSAGRFVAWAALRPQHWSAVLRLARNSSRAIHALCDRLRRDMAAEVPAAPVVTLEGEYRSHMKRKDA